MKKIGNKSLHIVAFSVAYSLCIVLSNNAAQATQSPQQQLLTSIQKNLNTLTTTQQNVIATQVTAIQTQFQQIQQSMQNKFQQIQQSMPNITPGPSQEQQITAAQAQIKPAIIAQLNATQALTNSLINQLAKVTIPVLTSQTQGLIQQIQQQIQQLIPPINTLSVAQQQQASSLNQQLATAINPPTATTIQALITTLFGQINTFEQQVQTQLQQLI